MLIPGKAHVPPVLGDPSSPPVVNPGWFWSAAGGEVLKVAAVRLGISRLAEHATSASSDLFAHNHPG